MTLPKLGVTIVTVLVTALALAGCASAPEGQPSAEKSDDVTAPAGTAQPEVLIGGPNCLSNCESHYLIALKGCAGDEGCNACSMQAYEACVSSCEGRIYHWKPC